MATIPIYAETGKQVGYYDTNKHTYFTHRDNKLNQIFWKKEFGNAVGISNNIIKRLITIETGFSSDVDVKKIKLNFMLINYEKDTVLYEITLFDFLVNSTETFFAGKENADQQKRCALKWFYKVDRNQERLLDATA